MTWGLFKKVVIADRLAPMVNHYYSNPQAFSGPELAMATVFFAVQIFCDFSGYSDIAIGAAQVMGFKLMVNFKRPYLALSISEFWKRWHISLSTWFRDYLYIPLGGNRVPPLRWQFNLFIVFLISGLWHGANWTFVIWGALHGLYLILEIKFQNVWKLISRKVRAVPPEWIMSFFQRLIVLVLVCYAWIFFRAPSVQDAFFIGTKVFTGWFDKPALLELMRAVLADYELLVTFFAIAIMEVVHYFQERGSIRSMLAGKPVIVRWTLYTGIMVCILIFGKLYSVPTDFIYFQF